MANAGDVFDGPAIIIEDDDREYGENRYIMMGLPADHMGRPAWTPRDDARRVIRRRKGQHL